MGNTGPRISRERVTLEKMARIYCRDVHKTATGLCPECSSLMEYAAARLSACPFGEGKPTCVKCPIHCYRQSERELMRTVMRHSGPRMIWEHPVLAIRHTIDGLRRPPRLKK